MSIVSPQSDPQFPAPLPSARPPLRHGQRMTVAQWLDLPENGPKCWVSDDVLHLAEHRSEDDMTWRNPRHCACTSRISHWLYLWIDAQPGPHGEVLTGEAAFQLSEKLGAGIDLAYVGPELVEECERARRAISGVPVLAVEVWSANDTHAEVAERIRGFLSAGIPHVWIVDPDAKTVTVHRPDEVPTFFTVKDEIDAEPHLPGFRAPVRKFFLRG